MPIISPQRTFVLSTVELASYEYCSTELLRAGSRHVLQSCWHVYMHAFVATVHNPSMHELRAEYVQSRLCRFDATCAGGFTVLLYLGTGHGQYTLQGLSRRHGTHLHVGQRSVLRQGHCRQ
jgi:hypothetical protein